MTAVALKTQRLVHALASGWAYHVELFQDRGPLCARLQLESMEPYDDAPALYATIDDGDCSFSGAGFGWKWQLSIGGLQDTEFEELGEVVIEIIERNHLGDTEEQVADQVIRLARLLLKGVQDMERVV